MLFPLLDSNLSRLGEEQRAALRSAFGFRGRAVPDRLALSHAALELLAQSGATTPILIVVDDLPWLDQASGMMLAPAWRQKPSWYLVATEDHMIPPPAQRAMAERVGATVAETPASHSVYLSQPQAVADLIKQAAEAALREA